MGRSSTEANWRFGFLFLESWNKSGAGQFCFQESNYEADLFLTMTLLPWKRVVPKSDPQTPRFEDLALPLLPSLYNVAVWLSRNPTDAEDLVQETFLKALRGFDGFEPGSNFKAWIFRILRNTYLTSRSGLAATRTVALEEELEERDDSGPRLVPEGAIDRQTPEVNVLWMSDRAALQAAMEKLSPPLLEVVLLCDVEEMKYREIASVLEIPIGTVMSRIARARAALREMLQGTVRVPGNSGAGGAEN
ncbi:MAG TPA: sigma-70 family RNA polymerase sigma factor [Acidobacteriaceae bacterium]|jgi:RNA polymerase sigma-70 factor (ECF subfamily)